MCEKARRGTAHHQNVFACKRVRQCRWTERLRAALSRLAVIQAEQPICKWLPAASLPSPVMHSAVKHALDCCAAAATSSMLCEARGVPFEADAIWRALENDDVLAAGLARLLLFTDPKPLPAVQQVDTAWNCYVRTWRPGKPHPEKWPSYHLASRRFLGLAS